MEIRLRHSLFQDAEEAVPSMGRRSCQMILSIWIRSFIFSFYQFQFFKPVFFLAMDEDLRGVFFKLFSWSNRESKSPDWHSSELGGKSKLSRNV